MMKKEFFALLLLILLSGCSTGYSCNTKTAGKCQSVSDVYKNVDKDGSVEEEKSEVASISGVSSGSINKLKEPIEGQAILSQPIVLRVLLNYWEDEDKDLNLGGYIFVKVRDAQWQML